MTGPEHFAEAERLVGNAQNALTAASPREVNAALMVANAATAAAQVHATLALAAATIDAAAHPGQSQVDYLGAWFKAAS